jgi:hypothetical protein
MKQVDSIIKELGGELLAAHKIGIEQQTLSYWRKVGVPRKHWRKIVRLTKGRVTLEKLLETLPR